MRQSNGGQWYWVWQQGYNTSYVKGGTRSKLAEDYIRQSRNVGEPVYIVEDEAPTRHVFAMVER